MMGVVLYLVMGGIIFSAVEGPNERRQIEMVQEERQLAFDNITAKVMAMSNLTLEEAQNVTIAFIALGEVASKSIPAELNPIWDYSSALFFASTVITTIGTYVTESKCEWACLKISISPFVICMGAVMGRQTLRLFLLSSHSTLV